MDYNPLDSKKDVAVRVDPITVEIIRCALKAAANEMSAVLKRTAYNMMIYEVQDYCVSIVDHEGLTMSQNEGALPIFLADLGVAVQDGVEIYGLDNIHPGDVFLVNHPEICGQHLNNMVVYTPFFWDGKLLCFLAVRAHWIDVGGGSTGFGSSNTRDVYEEGLQIRSVKIYNEGRPNTEVLRLIEDNIRFPESSLGDLRAQIACCRTGEERLSQICRKYGAKVFREAVETIWDQTDKLVRESVRAIPDGHYEASSFLDDDGRVMNKTIPIKVKITVRGDELTIDFSEVADQVPGFINCGSSGGMAAARVAFKALTSPQREVNEGSFRALKVILPPGKLLSARRPAPIGGWSLSLPTVLDTIFRALAPALPERVPAAHKGDMGGYAIFGNEFENRPALRLPEYYRRRLGRPSFRGRRFRVGIDVSGRRKKYADRIAGTLLSVALRVSFVPHRQRRRGEISRRHRRRSESKTDREFFSEPQHRSHQMSALGFTRRRRGRGERDDYPTQRQRGEAAGEIQPFAGSSRRDCDFSNRRRRWLR